MPHTLYTYNDATEFPGRRVKWRQRLGRSLWTAGGLLVGGSKRRWAALIVGTIFIGGSGLWSRWGLTELLSSLLNITFDVPAPGESLAPMIWTTPQNGQWTDVMTVTRVAVGISVVGLLIARPTPISEIAIRRTALKQLRKTAPRSTRTTDGFQRGSPTAAAPARNRYLAECRSTPYVVVRKPSIFGITRERGARE